MLDILGAIGLTLIAILCIGTLVLSGAPEDGSRRRIALLVAGWFTTIVALAAGGLFSTPHGLGTLAIGAAVAAPLLVGIIAFARSPSVRAFGMSIPLALLVGVHVGRLLGGFFVALHAAGRLPPTFALTAGWGDVLVGAAAVPLAWMIHRRASGWRTLTLAWNALALLDLVTAVLLGVGSAPDSPVRFIFENPNSGAMGTLPWLMIPGFLVPLYMLSHLVIFARLAASAPNPGQLPVGGAARVM